MITSATSDLSIIEFPSSQHVEEARVVPSVSLKMTPPQATLSVMSDPQFLLTTNRNKVAD